MKVLVTGANGFVGRWMVAALLEAGHEVVGAAGPAVGGSQPAVDASWVKLDLRDPASVKQAVAGGHDAIVHLAGEASGAASLKDPGLAWEINAAGSARLLGELGQRRAAGVGDPLVLLVSTADVYADGSGGPVAETHALLPRSPYAASKAGAELAARETALRTGLRVVIARPFPHTGPGQDDRFVAPAFARRLLEAKRTGAGKVSVGNLQVIRDFLDVRDVASAYLGLLEKGAGGETYNIASGRPVLLERLFFMLAELVGVAAEPEGDASLKRTADVSALVGDASKLRTATGWSPRFTLEETLRDLVHAQAN